MAITIQDIQATADKIAAEGGNPTLAAVRKAIGGGSFTTISEAMQLWKAKKQVVATPLREPAPASVTDRLMSFGAEIWTVSQEISNTRLQTEREALELVRQEMEATQKETIDLADQLSADLEQAQLVIENQSKELAKYEAEAAAMANELESERAERDKAERKAEKSAAALSESHQQVQALNTHVNDLKVEIKEVRQDANESNKKALILEAELLIASERWEASKEAGRSEKARYTCDLEKLTKALSDKDELIAFQNNKSEKALADKDQLIKSLNIKLETAIDNESKSIQAVRLLEGRIQGIEEQNKIYADRLTLSLGQQEKIPA